MKLHFKSATAFLSLTIAVFLMATIHGGDCSHCPSSRIIYVDACACTGGDGLSWSCAFRDLQSALDTAKRNGGQNEIWVAKGTYTPSALFPDIFISGTTPTFAIPDRTSLYGGFKGTERKRSERDPQKHVTILNGDIYRNDLPLSERTGPEFPTFVQDSYFNSKVDNARHVVTLLDVNVTLDGFTIRKGFAGNLPNLIVNEETNFLYRETMRGGGLWARNGSLILENIIFDDCEAYDGFNLFGGVGGALFTIDTRVILQNVTMQDGYAQFFSPSFLIANVTTSAIDCIACGLVVKNNVSDGCCASFQDTPFDLTKSQFKHNFATNFCGALQVLPIGIEPIRNSSITNCLFEENNGGVCAAIDLINESGFPMPITTIKNNSFVRNSATKLREDSSVTCGAICDYSYNALIENNVFEDNLGLTSGAICITQNDLENPVSTFLTIANNLFINNIQAGFDSLGGGAIHLIGDVNADILNNTFNKNKSDRNGGAIAVEHATAVIRCNSFKDNRAREFGSAIYALDSTLNDVIGSNNFKKFDSNTVVIQPALQKTAATQTLLKSAKPKKGQVVLDP